MKITHDTPLGTLGVTNVSEVTVTTYTIALGPGEGDSVGYIEHHSDRPNMSYNFRWQGCQYWHSNLEGAIANLKQLDRENRSDDPKDRMWKLPTY